VRADQSWLFVRLWNFRVKQNYIAIQNKVAGPGGLGVGVGLTVGLSAGALVARLTAGMAAQTHSSMFS
jgi:hypothetical protein